MRTNGNQVGVELLDVSERLFAEPLHGVRMVEHAALAAKRTDFRDGLERADFIVRRHDGNKHGVSAQRLAN
jgi:hypothetical protein